MDLTSHRADGTKGIFRVLKNGGHFLSQKVPPFFRAHFQKGLPFEVYGASGDASFGRKQAQDGFAKRGLSAAGLAYNGKALPSGKRKRNVTGGCLFSVANRDMGEAEYFRPTHCTSRSPVIS